jgi:hypothetical protein
MVYVRPLQGGWQAFVADYTKWVAGEEVLFLRPSPLESRRMLV